MSLTTLINKVIFQGNAAATVFPYSFIIPLVNEVVATFTDSAGTQTVLASSQYTITGINNANGGTITYPLTGSPMAVGESLTLQRIVPYTQPTVLTNQGGYYPGVVEAADDNIVMQVQQLAEQSARSLTFPAVDPVGNAVTTLPAWQARANKVLGFDASGNWQVTDPTLGAATSSANVNFLQAGTGGISRTLQSKGRDTVSLLDFGAVSGADCTTAITNFLARAAVVGYGYVPAGNYLDTLTRTLSGNTVIEGDGAGTTTFINSVATIALTISGSNNAFKGIAIVAANATDGIKILGATGGTSYNDIDASITTAAASAISLHLSSDDAARGISHNKISIVGTSGGNAYKETITSTGFINDNEFHHPILRITINPGTVAILNGSKGNIFYNSDASNYGAASGNKSFDLQGTTQNAQFYGGLIDTAANNTGFTLGVNTSSTIIIGTEIDCGTTITRNSTSLTDYVYCGNVIIVPEMGVDTLSSNSVAVANGLNSNIAIKAMRLIELTGPTSAYSVGGFLLPANTNMRGMEITLFNTVAQTLTIVNEDTASTADNRILTLTGGDVVLNTAAQSSAKIVYSNVQSRFVLTGHS